MKFTSKLTGIAAAAVLAGTMAFVPATALAATVSSTDTGANTKITKTWIVPSTAQYSDNEAFTFALTYKKADEVNNIHTATPTKDGSAFTTSNLVMNGSDFTANGTTYTANKTLADALSDVNFSAPGVYYFTLTEVAGSNQNIVYNSTNASYTVKVNVVWDTDEHDVPTTTAKIQSVQLLNAAGTDKADAAAFTNTDPNGNLTVSKTVKGTAANTTDDFSFKAELKDKDGKVLSGSYNYTKTAADGTTSNGAYTSGKPFTLKSGETFKIENLPEGAKYTVTETDAKGYDFTDVTAEGTTTQKTTTGSGTISQDGENDNVDFVNNKGFAPGTGITMNTLPFVAVGVVAVAGGAALVISRRRHAGEDF
ncbi:MAG: DUF5979 domain-containing protein [Atopobiaceae bacterium]